MPSPHRLIAASVLCLSALAATSIAAQTTLPVTFSRPSPRIVQAIDDTRLVPLRGGVHPLARPQFDRGVIPASTPIQRVVLVLQRSPQQEADLAAFNQRQYDPKSPNYHHWLHADEFGQRFGIADADIAQLTAWLRTQGLSVDEVSKGRLTLQFSGSAAQVQAAFHLQMHHYLVDGADHIANDRDPQIPEAIAPVVTGLASLNDFGHTHQSHPGNYVKRDRATGRITLLDEPSTPTVLHSTATATPLLQGAANNPPSTSPTPQFTFTDANTGYTREDLTPYDFATIYNILPLWNQGINGTGVHIAVVGVSDISLADVATFRSSFGLPANPPTIIHNGPDPGVNGGAGENTEDVEMAGASAPGASIDLVVSAGTASTSADILSALYIIDNEVAPILTGSYGECELFLGTAGNALYNSLWQQAATSGISAFESSGDEGSAGCTTQNGTAPYADGFGLAVNGIASSPYITAVGGTDLAWPLTEATYPISTYWNATNNPTTLATAKGYMPETTWNTTCSNPLLLNVYNYTSTEALCNAAINPDPSLVVISAGSGGLSNCTTPTGNTSATCAGGYPKPSWQTGPGVPADGKRDLPDVSMFASYGYRYSTGLPGSALLICYSSPAPTKACNYSNPNYVIYQENGGTSASSPLTAGIMALVLQKTGQNQGLANPAFYALAAAQNTAACNSNTVQPGNACIFYDTTQGSNAQVCITGDPNCVTNTSGDQAGILSGYAAAPGYDLSTGLGSINVTNLVNAWTTVAPIAAVNVSITPSTLGPAALGTAFSQQLTAVGGIAPYSWSVSSGTLPPWMTLTSTGILTGVPTSLTPYTFSITARDSSPTGPFAATQTYTLVVGAAVSASGISWVPSNVSTFTGLPLGSGVLDATDLTPGTFAYTALLTGNATPVTVTATSVLAAGSYTLTATFAPTATPASTVTATIPFTVVPEHIFVLNSTGTLLGLDAAGNGYSFAGGGGQGLAIDNNGVLWSAAVAGTSLSSFANTGAAFATGPAAAGLNNPAAIAIDGNGYIWAANANNSVSAISPLGVALSPSTGFTGGNLSTPSGIAIDNAGNVWISNAGNNSFTEILGGAAPVEPLATAQPQNALGVKP